jgi:hypothetical protein
LSPVEEQAPAVFDGREAFVSDPAGHHAFFDPEGFGKLDDVQIHG